MFKINFYENFRKTRTQFLLKWGLEEKKIALVKWSKICRPNEVGGLYIKKEVQLFNDSLLEKLKWWYASKNQGLCKDILESEYGDLREIKKAWSIQKYKSMRWRDLKKIIE